MNLTDLERETIETEITEKVWDRSRLFPGVIDIYMLNAVNHAFNGVYQFEDGREVCFKGQCGDYLGFDIQYSNELFDDNQLPKPRRYKLVPLNNTGTLPKSFIDSFIVREDNQKLLREANYDLFFSPTIKIEEHYTSIFAKKGLKLELEEPDYE